MKTHSAKAKGRKLQQWVRDCILSLSPELTSDDVRSTGMGQAGEDIQLSQAARSIWPISIECKSRATYAFYKDYDQAVENTPKEAFPVLVCKANRRDPVAIVDAQLFFELLRRLHNEV